MRRGGNVEAGMMHTRLAAALYVPFVLASCASRPELPIPTRDVTVCLVETLRTTPGVSHIRVFSAEPYPPVISYDVLTKDGIRGETDLGISGPLDDGNFRYSGAIGAGNNPID